MNAAIWLLVAIGSGGFGSPNLTVISTFNNELDCKSAIVSMRSQSSKLQFICSDVSTGKSKVDKPANKVEVGDVIVLKNSMLKVTKVKSTTKYTVIHGIRDGLYMNSYQMKNDKILSIVK